MSEEDFIKNEEEFQNTKNDDNFLPKNEEDVIFEEELEKYLPTPQNTDKIKRHIPNCMLPILSAVITCVVILFIYTLIILPHIRPSAVISYVAGRAETAEENLSGLSDIIEKTTPGIVTVSCKSDYRSFFGITTQNTSGTGIIISENGYILTSNTLIGSDGTAMVLIGNDAYEANVVGQDMAKDIAIVKIDKTGLSPISLGDSDSVRAGDTAIAVGNLLGNDLGISVTKGIICGVNKSVALSNGNSINIIQTDAATSELSTGGCILNTDGNIIGMLTSAISSGNDNISLAIPSNDISMIAESLINKGLAPSGLMIGFTGIDAEHGVTVESVVDDSPAKKAGLKKGDLILKVDDTVVKSVSEINKIRDMHKKGDTITLNIYRDGEIMNIKIKL